MANPTPTPTALKILRGNPGKRSLPKNEPQIKAEIPKRPQNLRDREARNEWDRMVALLEGAQIMSRVDVKILMMYCNAWSLYRQAMKQVNDEGLVVPSGRGNVAQHPSIKTMQTAENSMYRCLIQMGLTPAARTKVEALSEKGQDSVQSFLDAG